MVTEFIIWFITFLLSNRIFYQKDNDENLIERDINDITFICYKSEVFIELLDDLLVFSRKTNKSK